MNLSLFSTKPSEAGFRLHTYEVLNWGTFDKQVWSIEPSGETSLLTGANASGKTTMVDGLLTLLVPEKRMRFYNQTAGSKGERTEDSYVTGEYGETENADTQTREIKKLRADKTTAQSILLAVFKNETQYVTLAQARWYSGGDLKRVFILAYKKLSIADDFTPFDSAGEWKKRLKQKYPKQVNKDCIHLMDSTMEYGRLMRKIFGMRSEKAHTLFSQTIGLKVLGNLDEFVRFQMLEERDAENEFQKIKSYFKTLNDAHRAIEKANKQIELLKPIRDISLLLTKQKADLAFQESHKQIIPHWFAKKHQALINEYIEIEQKRKASLDEEIKTRSLTIDDLSDQERELDIQIKNDEIGSRISALEKQNNELKAEKEEREAELKNYNELAELSDFQKKPQSAELFEEQRNSAIEKKEKIKSILAQDDDTIFDLKIQQRELQQRFDDASDKLTVLRSQKNNITGATARIRNEILEYVGASETNIPFVGELIRVKPEASDWEYALEKVLHNFALRLIVPEEYYHQVNKYVQENDLRGRIIYHKFQHKNVAPAIFQTTEENELIHKIEFTNSEYTLWVRNEIETKFNYLCTDDMQQFSLSDKALTRHGLTKNASKHEKDDRPEIKNKQQYVLGWDNKEKITALKEQASLLNRELSQLTNKINYQKNHQNRIRKEDENLTRFVEVKLFKKIDWWSVAAQVNANEIKIKELGNTNSRVNTLKAQRDEILKELKILTKRVDDVKRDLNSIEHQINQQQQKLREVSGVLENYEGLDLLEVTTSFKDAFIKERSFSLGNVDTIKSEISRKINSDIEKLKDSIRREESAAEGLMRTFKNPDRTINDKFEDWNADTHKLTERAEFIEEYTAILDRIEKQELAGYRQQFKQYLNDEMITKMSDFQNWLERQEEDIEENIEVLNKSLEKINFKKTPPTFIKLHVEKDYSARVKEFKIKLNDWKPNIIEFERTKDYDILEESFNKIKRLLDQLMNEENTRKEVLDVRNWLKFRAVEHYREDPSRIFRSYTGTAKLSGGEGAQLTYTILGSAIAYQFGIHSEGINTNSFRFICVDEAFSKQDDEKAQFLMELCKQLHLQVMVVSPAKAEEVAIVEPYIARVHFVQRKDNRHSVIYDMPIKQLREHREQYLQVAE
ncbi:ATP-binding protein [Sphingobacterium mizutaii]|uniref:ATP-binding protein n=1 Tax=Sphingobacterium mizutaii TaxID=1010 RepID=UPI001625ECAE|nr:SbcC/MukB-like Walker B domain-containing protein [Sphingobacterium mizutaii]